MAEPGLAFGMAVFIIGSCMAGGALAGLVVGIVLVFTRGV